MARPKNSVPVPFLRHRKSAWQIRWTCDGEEYAMSIGAATKEEAKIICATAAIALAGKDEWPPDLITMPAVKRYIAKKSGNGNPFDDKTLIEKYAQHKKTNSRSNWYVSVRAHLNNASNFTGNLLSTNPAVLTDFLDAIHEAKTTATRNRAFASLSGFYRWLRLKHIMPKGYNPLEGITMLQEEHSPGGIIIWENNEIPLLLKAADTLKDGIAVWIAIYTGLRRGELARLQWPDIAPAYIIVKKSKTGIPRQVPLPKALAARLAKEKRTGARVLPWPEAFHGWDSAANRVIYDRLPKLLPKLHQKHPEKFGWNAFRHTFASRHAQIGTPLDVIAAWLGDSPKVCKEHYARYVPASMRDTRIDLVDDMPKKPRKKRATKEEKAKE